MSDTTSFGCPFPAQRGAQLAGGYIAEYVLKAKLLQKPSTFKKPLATPGQLQRLVGHYLSSLWFV